MILGFNTDIEYGGVTYHVQTEDKGLNSPLILSLIYTGGTILASKRTPYEDLIAAGFDEKILADRLNRQHNLICAAVRAGRIEDLKRLSAKGNGVAEAAASARGKKAKREEPTPQPTPSVDVITADAVAVAPVEAALPEIPAEEVIVAAPEEITPKEIPLEAIVSTHEQKIAAPPALHASPAEVAPAPNVTAPPPPPPPDPVTSSQPIVGAEAALKADNFRRAKPEAKSIGDQTLASLTYDNFKTPLGTGSLNIADINSLHLNLLDEQELRAGEVAVLCIRVGRGLNGVEAVADAEVTVKILGTTFHPVIINLKTNQFGMTVARTNLPKFNAGRAAVLVRAEYDGKEAMLRRVIQRS